MIVSWKFRRITRNQDIIEHDDKKPDSIRRARGTRSPC